MIRKSITRKGTANAVISLTGLIILAVSGALYPVPGKYGFEPANRAGRR